jgi:hypothetical protein
MLVTLYIEYMLRQPKVAGLSAVGFAVMIVLSNVVLVPAGLPLTGADAGEVTEFFATESGAVGLASAFGPLVWVLATVFGAGAVVALRGEVWALVGFAGLVLQNTTFTGVTAIRLALTQDSTAGLWALHDALFTLNGTFLALAMTGLSIGGLHGGLIRPWHARLGFTGAALQFTSATLAPLVIEHGGALGLIGLVGWLMWVGWLVAYGVALLRPALSSPSLGAGSATALG